MTRRSATRSLLLPLTPLYRVALGLRELRLHSGIESVRRLKYPVVSIGSLSAGGSGKTPLTIALARALTGRGLQVDVLSRGYGRKSKAALCVDPDGSAEDYGDEPLLIARESGRRVYVAQQRYDAGLLAESGRIDSHAQIVHLLDDGFQHRQLHRDVNVVIVDERDLHDHLLPAGNLREPLRALQRADAIATPSTSLETEAALRKLGWHGSIWKLQRRMAVPWIQGPVVAFCGIARSDQFFAGLESHGLHLASRIPFPDHHRFDQHDLDCVLGAARSINAAAFVTTEKDRVRLGKLVEQFSSVGPMLTAQLTIEIRDELETIDWLFSRLPYLRQSG